MGKLSETFRGIAGHLDHYATTAVGIETTALSFTKMFSSILHGFAGALEASPVTIPGPQIPPPAAH
jgi:hypothetical protein